MRARGILRLPAVFATASLLLAAVARADTTVATFADPASNGSTPLFELSDNTLSGGWTEPGLDLITPITGQNYPDATFTMTDLTLDPPGALSDGTIEFLDNGGGLILRIEFDSGHLFLPFGFGASTLVGNDLTFSGPIITFPLDDESFAFSFANQETTPNGFTWTAAFTSSAVPEPVTLSLLVLGGVSLAFSRRPE